MFSVFLSKIIPKLLHKQEKISDKIDVSMYHDDIVNSIL